MTRSLAAPFFTPLAFATLFLLGLGQAAAETPSLSYKVAVGGLNAGTFSTMTIPTHDVSLQGDDVKIVPKATEVDKRPIALTSGSVSTLVQKILKDKVGQQMTVEIEVVPAGVGAGQRCTFKLDHAFLKAYTNATMTFRPSELPEFECKG